MSHLAFARIDHRPWPLPTRRWSLKQRWCDLLFAHWPVPVAALRPLLPAQLEIEEFDGSAWVGVVPFRMEGISLRGCPAVPGLSAFPELNVRTYVSYRGRPGVWFFSLDAANSLAVWVARKRFHLPYFRAAMSIHASGPRFTYQSRRVSAQERPVLFLGSYGPVSSSHETKPGTIEHWLTERYRLYAQSHAGELYSADIHHLPWPLQHAEADITVNSMLDPWGISVSAEPPLLHFARALDVVIWSVERVGHG